MTTSAALATDVREGGAWSLRQRLKNDLIFALACLACLCARLPTRLLIAIGRGAGRVIHRLSPRLRATAERQLARNFDPVRVGALARENFVALGGLLGQALSLLVRESPPLSFPDADRLELARALGRGRGVVLASGHIGPFELVARTLAHEANLVVVARESYDPRLMAIYARLRPYRAIYRGTPGAGVRMLRVLRRGGVLGIPMDLATRAESVPAPFLGDPAAPTAVGPARLALRTGAAVVVATASGETSIRLSKIETDDLVATAEGEIELTRRINAELERRIRAMPTMWPWMHRRS